jgi:hypothetical protein
MPKELEWKIDAILFRFTAKKKKTPTTFPQLISYSSCNFITQICTLK